MLKIRVIPTLLWKDIGLVKGVKFDSSRRVGPILPAIKVYNSRDVDELALFDISANSSMREPNYALVREVARSFFAPFTVGGGITKIEHVEKLLEAGADKVSLNSALFSHPALMDDIAARFGSQCVMVSIDALRKPDGWLCKSESGTRLTNKDPRIWAKELADRGAGEILITSIDNDGTMNGYDIELVASICESVNIPVIASGGAGCARHMLEVLRSTSASAVAAASIFHFTEITPSEIKRELLENGLPIRVGL